MGSICLFVRFSACSILFSAVVPDPEIKLMIAKSSTITDSTRGWPALLFRRCRLKKTEDVPVTNIFGQVSADRLSADLEEGISVQPESDKK